MPSTLVRAQRPACTRSLLPVGCTALSVDRRRSADFLRARRGQLGPRNQRPEPLGNAPVGQALSAASAVADRRPCGAKVGRYLEIDEGTSP